ncbi:hypothetical protein EDD86DRAFT_64522 [Gorgonomyces haynaldii]|nr:hypothetical protein EDD86DRAFT_64522 [Gorgonomyces haynaldii]
MALVHWARATIVDGLCSGISRHENRSWNSLSHSIALESSKQVSLLCLYQEMIVIGNTLFTSIWNLETGRLLSVFRNPPELRLVLESNQNVRVVFHNPTLVIAAQEGQHFVFSVGQDNQMEYVQHVTDPEIANHGFSYSPMALICGTHYFIANGGFPDELSVYLLERQTPYFMNSQVHIHPELVLSKFNSFSVFEHVTEPTRSTNTVMGIMYPLSEAKAAERYHLSILPIRDLKSAYQDPDGSTIAACSHHTTDDFEQSLYVWDFRYERRRPRYFEKFHLAEKIVFICFESSPTWLE